MSTFRFKSILVLCPLLMLWTTGCASLEQSTEHISATIERGQSVTDDINTQIDELAILRESFPDGSTQAAAIDSKIAALRAQSSAIEAAIIHASQTLREANDPESTLVLGIEAISPWVPAPIQGPLLLGGALIATLIRSGAIKGATRSIVESIDHAKRHDPSFESALSSNASSIRSIQTPAARKLVQKFERESSARAGLLGS